MYSASILGLLQVHPIILLCSPMSLSFFFVPKSDRSLLYLYVLLDAIVKSSMVTAMNISVFLCILKYTFQSAMA